LRLVLYELGESLFSEEGWGSSAPPDSSHVSQKGLTLVCSLHF